MFVQLTIVIIVYFLLRHIHHHIHQQSMVKLPNPLIKLLQNWGGQDRIFKLCQHISIFVAGMINWNQMYVIDHARMIAISKTYRLDNISNGFAFVRKITRFSQTKHKVHNIKRQIHKINHQLYQKNRVLELILAVMADIFDTIYYFCDHFMALCIIIGAAYIYTDFQFWFSAIWLMSSLSAMIKDFAMFYRHVTKKKKNFLKLKKVKIDDENNQDSDPSDKQYYAQIDSQQQQQKFKKHLLLDFSKNLIDIVTNWAAMYPHLFAKKTVGMLGMTQSVFWMVDYLRVHG